MDGWNDEEELSEDIGREMLWKQLAEHFHKKQYMIREMRLSIHYVLTPSSYLSSLSYA